MRGRAALAESLLDQGRVDRCYLFVAPRLIGDGALPAFGPGLRPDPLAGFVPFGPTRAFGRDSLIVYDLVEDTA